MYPCDSFRFFNSVYNTQVNLLRVTYRRSSFTPFAFLPFATCGEWQVYFYASYAKYINITFVVFLGRLYMHTSRRYSCKLYLRFLSTQSFSARQWYRDIQLVVKTRKTQVCVRKGGNIYPWYPSEIPRRPENSKVCVREKANTYPRCLSIGRKDRRFTQRSQIWHTGRRPRDRRFQRSEDQEIADLTDRAATKRPQISAIGRPRDRRFERSGDYQ